MENKYIKLKNYIASLVEEGICIAFSGGVDSSLILKIACDEGKRLNKEVYAVTFETKLHPATDLIISKRVAKEMGAIHEIIQINEFENDEILKNPIDRCYLCKKLLFTNLIDFAKKHNLKNTVDGTNIDDLNVYRPGIRAVIELGIISPLSKLEITKEQVRGMAKLLEISVATRPSTPCLATRLPYNTNITIELLEKIDLGEEYIRKKGIEEVRLRVHGDIARIEVNLNDFGKLLDNKDNIISYLKELGFVYITLDMEGFRSGSMDVNYKELK